MEPEKWSAGIDPGAPPEDVARRCLEQRLGAVWHLLPLAAHHAEDDVEYVHHLRVATRRSMAALQLFEPLLPPRRTRRLRKDLRGTREAVGMARDLDVMLARHGHDSGRPGRRLRKRLRKRRVRAQGPIVRQCRRLSREGRFPLRVEALLRRVRSRGSEGPQRGFDEWARWRLREIVADFTARQPVDPTDLVALHRFRIGAKRLRYAMELLAPAFPDAFREELYPLVERLQNHLGEINDHAVALARFESWFDRDGRGSEAAYVQDVLRRERHQLDQALDRFHRWWELEHGRRLSEGLEKTLGDDAPRD